jgi:hypothetical protein
VQKCDILLGFHSLLTKVRIAVVQGGTATFLHYISALSHKSLEVNGENSETFEGGTPQIGSEHRRGSQPDSEGTGRCRAEHPNGEGNRIAARKPTGDANRSESEAISTAQVLDAGSARQLWISS